MKLKDTNARDAALPVCLAKWGAHFNRKVQRLVLWSSNLTYQHHRICKEPKHKPGPGGLIVVADNVD